MYNRVQSFITLTINLVSVWGKWQAHAQMCSFGFIISFSLVHKTVASISLVGFVGSINLGWSFCRRPIICPKNSWLY